MKYGKYMQENTVEEWRPYYLNYDELKRMIKVLADKEGKNLETDATLWGAGGGISLTVPPPRAAVPQTSTAQGTGSHDMEAGTDADITHEVFFAYLEKEIQKVHSFTHRKAEEIRKDLADVAHKLGIDSNTVPGQPIAAPDALKLKVARTGQEFLKLEKYVNLNYTGVHKILKKHDRWLTNPCRAFYLSRLQNHNWTRGDYSDILVTMSRVWSCLRGDVIPEAVQSEKQDFVRSTTKYWVKAEDVSAVKYVVLQNLPVFLQKSMEEQELVPDSQLVNSVYLDNSLLELYNGRLDKTPGAIAIRFRWYGTGTPELVFVERKTHREKWAMQMSVKERFIVQPSEVPDILAGRFNKEPHLKRMRAKGKSDKDIQAWDTLVTEICQTITVKQLVPTMRTQYMRTAFQIPYDATVRISLDTNLLMLTETGRLSQKTDRWFRDPDQPVPRNEITRFPHGVLEVKLQLKDEASKPSWVAELLESGMCHEVHKFSKFIHGCAVLLPEEVQAMPYWIDDPSIRDSIVASGSEELCGLGKGIDVGANAIYHHLLPNKHTEGPRKKAQSGQDDHPSIVSLKSQKSFYDQDAEEVDNWCESCCAKLCAWRGSSVPEGAAAKILPKVYLANERTFIHWLHMSVTMASLGIGVLAFTPADTLAEIYGFTMLPISIVFAFYALWTYNTRISMIPDRENGKWDDSVGPILLASVFVVALTAQAVYKFVYMYKNGVFSSAF